MAKTERDLQNIVDKIKEESEKLGLKMNVKKTKTMVISKRKSKTSIQVDGKELEQVDSFIYLGQMITEDGRCQDEIKRRIAIGKSVFNKRKHIFTSRNITAKTNQMLHLVNSTIWSRNMDIDERFNQPTRSIRNVDIQKNAEHPLDS
ncbi:uncharacterized protein LOC119740219 [Patiria miniata]|uniref:Endonuclease-reverse transcriptase n=1 Tax=Patiria miniata TaxID=46514 RepID=A0A914B7G7_PATMI|nr:uncharacterized protein LOC119740219 [Patiria miniata]